MNKIQLLSADVRACVRTGVALASFAQAVEELVLNSIDAGASSVAVRVDLTCFRIQVVDNGKGISFDQFQLIGERYSTSKCHTIEDLENLKYFGYRGEALASLRTAASFLEIVSRSRSSVMTHSKCFQNGVALGVIQASVPRPSAGTTVTAHDLFYNLPVRRKRVNSVLEMEKIRYRLAGIALIWPYISFSLRDDSAGHVILQTYKCSGMATSFSYIFTPARARGLLEVAAERDEFKLTGLVSRESYSRMDLQFVFINKRLVLKSSIHRQINKILSRSLILRRKGLTSELLEKNMNAGASSTGSPQKQSERYAIFVVNVECPYSAYDITFDPSKTLVEFQNWPKLIHLLQDMLYGFLRKENLISITEPVSSTTPCDVSDDDEIDEEENDEICQNNSNSENGLRNEKVDARRNLSLGAVHKSGKNISTFLDNGLFSKTVHRPKNQITGNAIVSEEPTKPMANICGKCQESSLSEQLQLDASSGDTVVLNVVQQNNRRHSSILNTSHLDNTGDTQQKSFQTCSKPDSFLTSQEENKTNTKQLHHQNAPRLSHCHSGNQSSLLYQHNSEKEIIAKPCLQATKHSLCEDSEEVIIKKPTLSKRGEITLGMSVQYSSTLKRLRDMNQMSYSSKVSEIITNTLQQLRCTTQKSVNNVGDLYKTPHKLPLSNDRGLLSTSHSKVENDEMTTVKELTTRHISNTYTSMQNNELRASIPHNYNLIQASSNQFCAENVAAFDNSISLSSKSRSSFNFRSTKEDRSLGESDRGNGQKRPSCRNTSHASKLAKLMRGKSTGDNQGLCDNDRDGTDSMKYTKILNAFNYKKQKKNIHFKHGDTKKGFTSSPCVPSGSIKECDQATDTSFSEDSLAWSTDIAAQHLVSKRGKGTAGSIGKGRWDLNVSSSSNTKQLCSKAACNRCCCCLTTHQSRGQLSHVGGSLPFSMYKADDTVENAEAENSSPKVSVILSLPLDDSEFNSSCLENLKRNEKDKSALLSNQNIHIHTVNSVPGHSFVGGNVNAGGSTVVMPIHNHGIIYSKNKDNRMQSMTKQSPDQSLPKTNLILARDSLVGDQLNIIFQSEAGSCGSNASSPQMSQGFTLTTTQLDKDDSESLSDDVSSVCKLQCKNSANNDVELPNRCASSGFSPASEVSSSSLERSSPWIQPHYKASVNCVQSKITDSTGASVNYITLSDSDTEIYVQNANNTEPTCTLPVNLCCEETLSSQETDLDTQLQKDSEVSSVNCSDSVLTSSVMPKIANTNIDNVVQNAQDELVSQPVTVCATTPDIETMQPQKEPIIQAYQAWHDPNASTTLDTEDVERVEQDSIGEDVERVEQDSISEDVERVEQDSISEDVERVEQYSISEDVERVEQDSISEDVERVEQDSISEDVERVEQDSISEDVERVEQDNIGEDVERVEQDSISEDVERVEQDSISEDVERVEQDSISEDVERVEQDSIGEDVERVEQDSISEDVERVEQDSISEDVERVEQDSISEDVERVEQDNIGEDVERVEQDSISEDVERVEQDSIGEDVERVEQDSISEDVERVEQDSIGEDVERVEQDSISDSVPDIGLELVDNVLGNDGKGNDLLKEYHEDKNDFSEITDMISDAKQMFKNMREFLGASIPAQDLFTHSCNIGKAPVTTSHHGYTVEHSRSSADFLENVTGSTACDNRAGSEVHSSRTSIENHIIGSELRPVPEAVEKDTFLSSLRSGLHRDSETCSKRDRSGNISNLNTVFLPIEVMRSDPSYQNTEHAVCGDNCVSLKDGLDLYSEQPCRSSHSLRFQMSPTVSKNHSEETLGHIFSCVHEKDTAQRPEFLYPEAKSDNYDSESKKEFEQVNCKHTQVQNPCKNSSMLDGEENLQIEKPSYLLNKRHTDSENDQEDVMSSEGDQLLMMIHDSVLSPGKAPDKCESSSRGNSSTRSECLSPEKASCFSRNEDMSFVKVPPEIGQSTVSVEAVYTSDAMMDNCKVAETLRYQASDSDIGLSYFDGIVNNRSDSQGNLQSVLVSSSLSLIRSDGLTEGSSKKLHPEGHLRRGDVSSANTGTAPEVVLSAANEKPLSVIQVTSNADSAADQDIQMEAASSPKNENIVEIESQHNKTDVECQKEISETACWKEVVDSETGTRTFVSNLSGHTVSEEQWRQLSSQTQKEMLGIHSACVVVPAVSGPAVFSASQKQAFKDLVTDHFEQEENEALSKWRTGERPVYDKSVEADISALMAKWTNPVFLNYKQPGILADPCPSDAVPRSCFNSLSSVGFTKGILDKVKVVGQLDNKFIVSMIDNPESCSKATRSKCSSLLVLFDQHAVHERIRLEHFTKECYEVEGGERTDRIKRAEIKPAQSITMDQDDLRIMKAFSNEFNRIGINFSVDKISRNTIHITSFPLCLMEKDASELKKNKISSVIETVENLIKEHIELLKSTNGACGRLPLTIHKVLCSQACHGAVKFGDKLTVQECQDLLSSLAFCNLPFQCAHGRPSLAPLVNLDAVERELLSMRRPPNLWKISQNMKH